ncbi:MAG: CDP-diacylglycerol--serine O-phosphatidyltransferase [Daejeonella sp.]|uniref:CDP-diacylglycerol--serine O-phosphatidyltransferase n=1 Tax=Daejeonella sp. JGW-45 TaxID=3034148 RepID=UPI0023EDD934|nr:CDP-diacylglycerol--serine O-phosphatidyltransferase [Daejeonella sp. JGW-45]
MKKHIPNTVTCLNLFSGCLGVVFAFEGNLHWASYAIFIAAVFDFLDGMLARLLQAYSDIGKELDSLADVVSFGFLPSVIIYQLFQQSAHPYSSWLNYTAFLIVIFSALRLAKFNIDTRQSDNFIGFPTPANAILIASLPFIADQGIFMSFLPGSPLFLVVLSLGMGLLLVSEIQLISLKFKGLNLNANAHRYILVISSLVLLLLLKFAAVPLIILLYFLISFIHFRSTK